MFARSGVEEGDGRLAFRIRIGVRAIGHHGYRKRAYGLAIAIRGSAGAQSDLIMGDVAGVGAARSFSISEGSCGGRSGGIDRYVARRCGRQV